MPTFSNDVASGFLVILLAVVGSDLAVLDTIGCRWHRSSSSLLERVELHVSSYVLC